MIATRFAVSVHLLALLAQECGESMSSDVLASSIGVNPVIVRTLLGKLRKAGLVRTKRGVPGATVARQLQKITLLDIFDAVELRGQLFSIHDQPNPKCPVGGNIQHTLERFFDSAEMALKRSLAKLTVADVVNDLARPAKPKQPAKPKLRS
jgi:Rrf2 family protein